jgi:hypothetical protein
MGIAEAVRPVQAISVKELSLEMANHTKHVEWGTPEAEADDKIAVTLQLKTALDEDYAGAEILRLTCEEGATMTLKAAGNGTVLSGDASEDIIIQTDETTGSFDLELSYESTGNITVVAGQTQGSGGTDCSQYVELTFA